MSLFNVAGLLCCIGALFDDWPHEPRAIVDVVWANDIVKIFGCIGCAAPVPVGILAKVFPRLDCYGTIAQICMVISIEFMGIRVFDDEQIRVGFIHIVADVTVDAVADDEVFSEFVATEFVGEMFVIQLVFDVVEIWFEQLGDDVDWGWLGYDDSFLSGIEIFCVWYVVSVAFNSLFHC